MFDSNLSDVPMVYTVASDGLALSINQMPELTVVPFGVTCSSDELVDVECSMNNFECSMLYVFDALLGTTTAVIEGQPIRVQPNDYGRYYLTTNEKIGSKVADGVVEGIVISVRQDGVVTVSAQSQIGRVRVVSVSGAVVYEQADCGNNTQFRLQPGTYVIEAEVDGSKRAVKIVVK